jgi:hypothetical protein
MLTAWSVHVFTVGLVGQATDDHNVAIVPSTNPAVIQLGAKVVQPAPEESELEPEQQEVYRRGPPQEVCQQVVQKVDGQKELLEH